MSIIARTAAATVAVGAAAALALGLAAPAQAAAAAHATLGVVNEGTGYYWIPVDGVFPMSRAAAQDAINHGYTVQLRLWGDDPYSDDLQYSYGNAYLSAGDDGLHFSRSARVPRSVVNEDDSWTDDHDELYVGARAVGPTGNIALKVESNHVGGYF